MFSLFPIVIVSVVLLGVIALISVLSSKRSSGRGKKSMPEKKDDSRIIKEATRKLKQDPHHTASLVELSDCYFRRHEWEKAFPLYNTLVDIARLHPEVDEFTVALRQGICALKLGKTQDSFKGLAVAYRLKPDDFDTCYNLGIACYENNDFARAIPCLKKALVVRPDTSSVYRPMGLALYKSGKFRESLNFLRRTIDEYPDDKEILFAMADAMYESGYGEKAMKIFMHLRPDPVYGPRSCLATGKMNLNAKQYDKALQDFEIGLRIPDVPPEVAVELRYNMAQTCFASNKIALGLDLLKQIQSIVPTYKDVAVLMARYQELNQNTNLQTYLMSGTSDFVALCRKAVVTFCQNSFVKILDITVNQDSADILCTVETTKWEDTELFRFYRTSGVVGELFVREFHNKIKDTKADKGICFAAGMFSEGAHKYIEGRPIDLVEKDALIKLLKRVASPN